MRRREPPFWCRTRLDFIAFLRRHRFPIDRRSMRDLAIRYQDRISKMIRKRLSKPKRASATPQYSKPQHRECARLRHAPNHTVSEPVESARARLRRHRDRCLDRDCGSVTFGSPPGLVTFW
jgi:hypothetical protein